MCTNSDPNSDLCQLTVQVKVLWDDQKAKVSNCKTVSFPLGFKERKEEKYLSLKHNIVSGKKYGIKPKRTKNLTDLNECDLKPDESSICFELQRRNRILESI